MNDKESFQFLKSVGCCNACCLRYMGVKNPNAYEKLDEYIAKYTETSSTDQSTSKNDQSNSHTNGSTPKSDDATSPPPAKRRKWEVCVSCLGVLQMETWKDACDKAKELVEKKKYACPTFACALSAPIATLLREKAVGLLMKERWAEYDENVLTPLKEAWKWGFAVELAKTIEKTLDSGSVSPLLITLNLEYPDDLEELEPLKKLSPDLFESRNRQKRRFTVEMTRRSVQEALENLTVAAMKTVWPQVLPSTGKSVECVSVVAAHAPIYLGGRYIKLSRELCQTPWVLNGVRMMESSVQEIIFEPIAKLYGITSSESEHRLKFISAGREDVDVRCLGSGRPFAVEVSDPRRDPTEKELQDICEDISKDGRVVVKKLHIVTKDDLTLLKQGEETKFKTYDALCIKLTHSEDELANGVSSQQPIVTQQDIDNINSYTNMTSQEARIKIIQKTPIRVLHRRPLLKRERKVLELSADFVKDHPQLFTIRIVTEAGTYIKEFVHSELRRSEPSLRDAIKASTDILALDVAKVHLDWPTAQL